MKPFLVVFLLCVTLATYSLGKPTVSDSKKAQGDKLSDAQHYTEGGKHDHTYDHEAFLGKERADQFKELTPEESRRRLGIIVDKIDRNKDGEVDKEELTYWIKHSLKKNAYDDAAQQMEYQDLDKSGDVDFDEWVNTSYSYMSREDRIDEYADQYRKVTYREQIARDRKSWGVADQNMDGRLDVDEFAAFLRPHDFPHMNEVVLEKTMNEMDANKDGFITKEEFISDIYHPERDGAEEPEWLQREKDNFNAHRDQNGDGKLDKEEMRKWILPTHHDPYETEARHLIEDADTNEDKVLTKEEILEHQDTFVASRVTNFGEQLNKHDEF